MIILDSVTGIKLNTLEAWTTGGGEMTFTKDSIFYVPAAQGLNSVHYYYIKTPQDSFCYRFAYWVGPNGGYVPNTPVDTVFHYHGKFIMYGDSLFFWGQDDPTQKYLAFWGVKLP
jgi:hypothetical protein